MAAHLGHAVMSDLSPLSGEERKSDLGAVRSVLAQTRHVEELKRLPHGLPSSPQSVEATFFRFIQVIRPCVTSR
jgi:hypothetical protein